MPLGRHRRRGVVMLVGCVLAAAAWAGLLAVPKDHDIVRNPRVFKVLGFPLAGAVIVALFGLAKLVLGRSLGEIGQDGTSSRAGCAGSSGYSWWRSRSL